MPIVKPCSSHFRLPLLLCLTLLTSAYAWDIYPQDPFGVNAAVPLSPAKAMLGGRGDDPCAMGALPTVLDIASASERALCANPKTRLAWANVKVQAAQLGGADAAYLPSVSGQLQTAYDHATSTVPEQPLFNTDSRTHYTTGTLSLSWLLYDAGARAAAVRQAQSLLDAAQASQDVAVQSVLLTTARDYYTALAAQTTLDTAEQVEQASQQSLTAASERVKGGVAPVTDQLQAQTAYAQAVYNRAKARGELRTALGTLALDMGLSPATLLSLTTQTNPAQLVAASAQSAAALLDMAQRQHPSLQSARAQLEVARDKAEQVRAQGLPSLALSSHVNRSNQPVSPSLGSPKLAAQGRDRYIGLELNIPLFEGFTRNYQIRQAEAQIEVQQATLADAEQQVAQEVWHSYQTLQTAIENVHNSEILLQSASQSFEAAQRRYERGVGNILELLNAQTAYANAQQQRVQAVTEWRIGRLQLVASIGRLTMRDL